MTDPVFQVGDRVRRPALFATDVVWVGTVAEVYPSAKDGLGAFRWLYAVTWDYGSTERGYFAEGLTRVTEAD